MIKSVLTDAELADIAQARDITDRIAKLQDSVNVLLDPVVEKAVSYNVEQLRALIEIMPQGFHRTELRTLLNTKSKAQESYILGESPAFSALISS